MLEAVGATALIVRPELGRPNYEMRPLPLCPERWQMVGCTQRRVDQLDLLTRVEVEAMNRVVQMAVEIPEATGIVR
jgi:hypothetical protein